MSLGKFLEEMKKSLVIHAVAAHFSNGLIPVAVLYLMFTLMTGSTFYEHTVIHLLVIVLLAIPVSFISGIMDWKRKYKGAKAPIFVKKIRLAIVLSVLAVTAMAIRLFVPGVSEQSGPLFWAYSTILFAMLPVVVLLGHYGGKLSASQRQEKFR
jgi:peptidoglycan/LPS O-acetylase OafA/YrhL